MNESRQAETRTVPDSDVSLLQDHELDTVSGGFGALFVAGFIGGVIAKNIQADRPWYEF
jgi:hypothetical protein